MKQQQHEYVVGNKAGRFIFRCSRGDEHELMSSMMDLIFSEKTDFDWSDAVEVTFGIIDDLVIERDALEGPLSPF